MRISDWSSDVCSSDLRSNRCSWRWRWELRRCRPCRLDLCLCCARRLGRLFVAGSAPLFRPDWFPGGPRHDRCSHREPQVVIIGLPMSMRRSEEHTSELQSLMRISYAVFCLKKKITQQRKHKESTTRTVR